MASGVLMCTARDNARGPGARQARPGPRGSIMRSMLSNELQHSRAARRPEPGEVDAGARRGAAVAPAVPRCVEAPGRALAAQQRRDTAALHVEERQLDAAGGR